MFADHGPQAKARRIPAVGLPLRWRHLPAARWVLASALAVVVVAVFFIAPEWVVVGRPSLLALVLAIAIGLLAYLQLESRVLQRDLRSARVRSVDARDLERQFAGDARVHVIHGDAASLPYELKRHGIASCDYILSGIPFSILKIDKKRALLRKTHDALALGGSFIIYQVTNELKQHATLFEHGESEYFLQNIPPMFITVFHKAPLNDREYRTRRRRSVAVCADRSA